jgi:glutamine synthetase
MSSAKQLKEAFAEDHVHQSINVKQQRKKPRVRRAKENSSTIAWHILRTMKHFRRNHLLLPPRYQSYARLKDTERRSMMFVAD